jgi:phage gpG-like protein
MSKFNFYRVLDNLNKIKRELPVLLANQAENYFVDNFKKQGFDNKKWQEVQRRIAETRPYMYPKNKGLSRRKKPILIGSGRLRRAVANSKKITTFNKILLEVNLPYAANHNEGDTVPKRQYIGQTRELTNKRVKLINSTVDRIWQA